MIIYVWIQSSQRNWGDWFRNGNSRRQKWRFLHGLAEKAPTVLESGLLSPELNLQRFFQNSLTLRVTNYLVSAGLLENLFRVQWNLWRNLHSNPSLRYLSSLAGGLEKGAQCKWSEFSQFGDINGILIKASLRCPGQKIKGPPPLGSHCPADTDKSMPSSSFTNLSLNLSR